MILSDAVLDLAQYAQGIEYYKISEVFYDNMRFTLSALGAPLGKYTDGGTCFFLDGPSAGEYASITSGSENTIHLQIPMTKGLEPGNRVAITPWRYFDTRRLEAAVNHVLYNYPVMKIWTSPEELTGDQETDMRYVPWQTEYTLPAEITSDIRRVEIECCRPFPIEPYHVTIRQNLIDYEFESDLQPDPHYAISHYWKHEGSTLIIRPRPAYRKGGRFRIHYVDHHGYAFEPTDELDPIVDRTYIRMMASLYLWAHEITSTHKDNPIAIDMFNQAKQYEETLRKKNNPELKLMRPDTRFYW